MRLFSPTGAVTGFKMDHFNALDPRKQELLEARIGGRVMEPPFLVASEIESGGVQDIPRDTSCHLNNPSPAPVHLSSGAAVGKNSNGGGGGSSVGIGEQATTSSSLILRLDPSPSCMGTRQQQQQIPGSPTTQASDMVMKQSPPAQYGTVQPGYVPYRSEVGVNLNRQGHSSLPVSQTNLCGFGGQERQVVRLENLVDSGRDTLVNQIQSPGWDKKSVDSGYRSNTLPGSAARLYNTPENARVGVADPEENCKPSNRKTPKSNPFPVTLDKPVIGGGGLEYSPTGDPSGKKTPKARRHLASSSHRGARRSRKPTGEMARPPPNRLDSPLHLNTETGRLEKVRTALIDCAASSCSVCHCQSKTSGSHHRHTGLNFFLVTRTESLDEFKPAVSCKLPEVGNCRV